MFKAWMFVKTTIFKNTIIVESEAEVAALGRITNLCKSICKHRFSDTVYKMNFADLNVAFDHVMSNAKMSNTSEFVGIAREDFCSSGIRVHCVGFDGLEMEKFETHLDILDVLDA